MPTRRRRSTKEDMLPTNYEVLQRELPILDVMTANRDRRIWAIARGADRAADLEGRRLATRRRSSTPDEQARQGAERRAPLPRRRAKPSRR